MPNTSATGGYLQATTLTGSDVDFRRAIHGFIVGLTGLPPELVRPSWQPNPPPMPDQGVNWCGYGQLSSEAEGFPELTYYDADSHIQTRYENVIFNISFYGPQCLEKMKAFRDAMLISQNLDPLFDVGIALFNSSGIVHAPELVGNQYMDRSDIQLTFNKKMQRLYAIKTIVSGEIQFNTDIPEYQSTIYIEQ